MYTATSPLIGPPGCTAPHAAAWLIDQGGAYGAVSLARIVTLYWATALPVGIDPLLALAQCVHETSEHWPTPQDKMHPLSSFWSIRPRRNPAGIGVTGRRQEDAPADQTDWAYNDQRMVWEAGLSFAAWEDSVVAHIGRLLGYAIRPPAMLTAQHTLYSAATRRRPLPGVVLGSAPTLKALGKKHNPSGSGWASPGPDYGARIAAKANAIREWHG